MDPIETRCSPRLIRAAVNAVALAVSRLLIPLTLCGLVVPSAAVDAREPAPRGSSPPSLFEVAGLAPGPHAVGFRSLRLHDRSRPWPSIADPAGKEGRPIQIGLWYPASLTEGERMSLGDYIVADRSDTATASATTRQTAEKEARSILEAILGSALPDDAWSRVWSTSTSARFDSPPLRGRRPLVLFLGGLRARSHFFVPFAEKLASHGYVVAALATYPRSETERLGFDLDAVRTQIADMETALERLRDESQIDDTRVALAGWSFGGVSQAVWRQRNPRSFRAAVSLDSGSGYAYGAELLEAAGGVDPHRLTIPFLALEAARDDGEVPRDDRFLRAHRPGIFERTRLPRLGHGDLLLLSGIGRAIASSSSFAGLDSAAAPMIRFLEKHLPPASSERVTLTSDGWLLAGDFVLPDRGAPGPAVLLLNKAAGTREAYREMAEELARVGIASLRLDLRGHGESINLGRFVPAEGTEILEGSDRDVVAAVHWLAGRPEVDGGRIGVTGASYSGEAMMIAAETTGYAAAYVGLSPGSLSDDSIAAVEHHCVPWLLVVSRHERYLGPVVDAVREQSRTIELLELSGTMHATNLLASHPDLPARLALWFRQRLTSVAPGPR